jgi:mannose-6-phosphate isomerase
VLECALRGGDTLDGVVNGLTMAYEQIYPYILEPKETTAIWGGDALVTRYGKPGDSLVKIGESWECWDANRVANGALAGKTLAELRETLGARLLGDLDSHHIFPILTKIIDARDWLSVQVHPGDAYAHRVEHQDNGKTECWYILSARDDAQLVLGWTQDTSRQEYERRVADGSLGDLLRRVPAKAGETFYLPAGTLHAIGAGIVLFETQQASDLTYRIFDWNRVGVDGKPRELHVAKAADVLDYKAGTRGAIEPLQYRYEGLDRTALVADPRFIVEHVVATDEPASLAPEKRPLIIMALETPLRIEARETIALAPYQTALVPAALEWCTVTADAGRAAPFMLVTPPPYADALQVRMLAAGIDQDSIDGFMLQFQQ